MNQNLRRSLSAILVAMLLLWGQTALALEYYQAGPRGTVGISRPAIQQQLLLTPDETIQSVSMELDGVSVPASWDKSGLVTYQPVVPLTPGVHTVHLSVEIAAGAAGYYYDPVVSLYSFTVAPNSITTLPVPGPEELQAMAMVNRYRKAAGLTPVSYSNSLGAAAVAHARYLVANPDQQQQNPHQEIPGDAAFFGAGPGDRVSYYGYTGSDSEVINFKATAEDAVDGWMETLYHRIPLLEPATREIGYGLAAGPDGPVDVMEAGAAGDVDGMIAWPYDGQRNVPTGWDGLEIPDPFRLYPNTEKPVGYTISLTFGSRPRRLTLQTGTVTGPAGNVPVMSFDPTMDSHLSDTVGLIPNRPLDPGTTYRVHLAGAADYGNGPLPFDRTWSFTTAATPHLELVSQTAHLVNGLVSQVTVAGYGFAKGLRAYLGGLPVESLQVTSPGELTFAPPAGLAGGSADLVVASEGGQEAVWPGFLTADERTAGAGRQAFTQVPLYVSGNPWPVPALAHSSGVTLVPENVLGALGQPVTVAAINRTYWTAGGHTGNYTLGRLRADVDGTPLELGLPVQRVNGVAYVDMEFVRKLTGLPVMASPSHVVVGLQDIAGHWAHDAILQLVQAGVVSGTGDGLFQPDANLTRAAFVKMLVGARKLPLRPGEDGGLVDMKTHWAAAQGYMGAAVRAGIVVPAEYPDGRFGPDLPISREEMAVMVTRALGLNAEALSQSLTAVNGYVTVAGRTFEDADRWTRPGYVATAVAHGIISGYPESDGRYTYRPNRLATRAEAVVMVLRAMGK